MKVSNVDASRRVGGLGGGKPTQNKFRLNVQGVCVCTLARFGQSKVAC
jgi:hypothetical protein